MKEAETDPLFTALTKPVAIKGVPLYYFGTNAMVLAMSIIATTDLLFFIGFAAFVNLPMHFLGRWLMERDHHFMTIIWVKSKLPPVHTKALWKCRSFCP
jgi:type IV secretory pathway VirB3-like protein